MRKYGFVVEGVHDQDKLAMVVPTAQFVVTEGTRFNNRISDAILDLICTCDRVYLLTDPDHAGDILAEMVNNEFPNLRRIRLAQSQCKCYRRGRIKIGVEHASTEYLTKVLSNYIGKP